MLAKASVSLNAMEFAPVCFARREEFHAEC